MTLAIWLPSKYRMDPLPYNPGRLLMSAWLSSLSCEALAFAGASARNDGYPDSGFTLRTPSGVSTNATSTGGIA